MPRITKTQNLAVYLILVAVVNDIPSTSNHKNYEGIRFIGVTNEKSENIDNSIKDNSGKNHCYVPFCGLSYTQSISDNLYLY